MNAPEEQTNLEPAGKKAGKSASLSLAAILMMAGLLFSKITGQLREILVVPILGLGTGSDAFFLGFQIPDLFYQLLVGGAIQAAITPSLAASLEKKQEKKGWRSLSIFINLAAIVMLIAVAAGELLAPQLIQMYNSKKEPAVIALAIEVTRALFPQVFFMMLAALCIGILNAYKKFSSTAFGPSVYNICVILAMIILGRSGAVGAATGVMLSAFVYFVMQFILARREFRNYTFSLDYHDSGFRRLLHLAVPTLISGSIVQVNMIILTAFANENPGDVTLLRNASTTWQLPYGVFAVALGNVMLPSLAGYHARQDVTAGRRIYTRSLRSALFLIFPSAALFLVMQQDTIRAIFQWSKDYSDRSIAVAASILGWYCLAMVAQTVIFITNQAFYARKVTRVALYNGILTLILNALFSWLLTRFTPLGVSSLSLSYAMTSLISAVLLYLIYSRGFPGAAPKRLWPFIMRCCLCASVLILTVLALNTLPIAPAGKIAQLIWFAVRAAIGLAIYLTAAYALQMPESAQTLEKIGRIWKKLTGGKSVQS